MKKIWLLLIAIMVLLLAAGCSANETVEDTVQIAENEVPLSDGATAEDTAGVDDVSGSSSSGWEVVEEPQAASSETSAATPIDPAGLLPIFLQLSSVDITEAGGYTHSISGTDYGVASKPVELFGRQAEVFVRYDPQGDASAIYYNMTGSGAQDAADLFMELSGEVSNQYGTHYSFLTTSSGDVSSFTGQDIVDAAVEGTAEASHMWLEDADVKTSLSLDIDGEAYELTLIYLTGEYYDTLG